MLTLGSGEKWTSTMAWDKRSIPLYWKHVEPHAPRYCHIFLFNLYEAIKISNHWLEISSYKGGHDINLSPKMQTHLFSIHIERIYQPQSLTQYIWRHAYVCSSIKGQQAPLISPETTEVVAIPYSFLHGTHQAHYSNDFVHGGGFVSASFHHVFYLPILRSLQR
jgi:hypothetical protein